MKKFELYFQKVDFEKPSDENKIKLAEFETIEELEKNYLNYFDVNHPYDDWEIKYFDLVIKELNEEKTSDGIILAINTLALNMIQLSNIESESNFLLDLIKDLEVPPLMLCVSYK